MTAEVAEALLKELIPRFGPVGSLERDNGTAFVSQVTKGIMSALGIFWTLHSVWRPPIIRGSREIQSDLEISLLFKETLHQETQENWIKLLLIALIRMQLAQS